MSQAPNDLKARTLLTYIAGRIDQLEQRVEANHREATERDRRATVLSVLMVGLKYSGQISNAASTLFIAGYIAINHSWYLHKVKTWISILLSWHL